ncbi:MAG: HAMP domain-containing histidine kinase [Lachnospiraceae bacterium]|nr:HAMP domain-containing histidine kinase [Lachnospiraceae bacterium]
MHRTLYLQFLAAYVLFGVLSFLAIVTVSSEAMMRNLVKVKADSLYREASLVANGYAMSIYNNDPNSREAAVAQLRAIDTYVSAAVWIINNSGKVIFESREGSWDHEKSFLDFDPAFTGRYYMTGDFYGAFKEATLSVFSPITSKYKVVGYVVIHSSMADIRRSRDSILRVELMTLGIIMGFSLIILAVFTIKVYLPLTKVTKAAEEYAEGNMSYNIEGTETQDEMGYLAATLAFMAHEISKSEDSQRKFIANVSHDFRSPLTSIRGYLEAVIDGTIPPEMHEKYLKIVLDETLRLTKLTNGLLELNSLSSVGMVLDLTDFDINSVIKATAESFGGQCREKKISIELILTGDELRVRGDQDRIKQVLYNLLDNAIKFSHNNSIIKIETTEKGDRIYISVKDFGIGIPQDSVKLIFDRFYKTDLSRGKDKRGTGLGLAIVKEIIQAHNENINVISTEGVGSEFIFTLPTAEEK